MIYLDRVGADFGRAELDRHWRRVFLGYASLQIVPRRAWAVLFTRFLLRFGPKRLKKSVLGWRAPCGPRFARCSLGPGTTFRDPALAC